MKNLPRMLVSRLALPKTTSRAVASDARHLLQLRPTATPIVTGPFSVGVVERRLLLLEETGRSIAQLEARVVTDSPPAAGLPSSRRSPRVIVIRAAGSAGFVPAVVGFDTARARGRPERRTPGATSRCRPDAPWSEKGREARDCCGATRNSAGRRRGERRRRFHHRAREWSGRPRPPAR